MRPRPPSTPSAARFIVQVGAFGENKAAQDVRLKVEKLGLKTYAQAVDTADGRRVACAPGAVLPAGTRPSEPPPS